VKFADESVFGFGDGSGGQFGNDQIIFRTKDFTKVHLDKVHKFASGDEHCLAIDAKGHVYSWGLGHHGKLA